MAVTLPGAHVSVDIVERELCDFDASLLSHSFLKLRPRSRDSFKSQLSTRDTVQRSVKRLRKRKSVVQMGLLDAGNPLGRHVSVDIVERELCDFDASLLIHPFLSSPPPYDTSNRTQTTPCGCCVSFPVLTTTTFVLVLTTQDRPALQLLAWG